MSSVGISFNLNVFDTLREKYPTWELLRTFLESEDGGLINVVDTSNDLCIIRYDKQHSKFDLPYTKWFRSVVWDTKKNMPICVAPSKCSDSDFNFNCETPELYCQEFIEGFMINCFKIVGDDKFYITSRSCFDATGKFYSTKTFRELFNEAITNESGNIDTFMNKYLEDINESDGELSRFYSFVVYHPEHRMVAKRLIPGYYEVHSGTVYADGKVVIQDKMSIPRIPLNSSDSVQEFVQEFFSKKDWDFQGIVFKDSNGNRWRFRNEKYQMVKSLRGNVADSLTRYIQLFQQNITRKYLEFYPEESALFEIYNIILLTLVNVLLNYYKSLHVYKTVIRDDIDKMYWPHLYNLHGHYLANLKGKGTVLSVQDIQQYLQKQPWQRIIFLMKKFMGELGV